MYCTILHYIVVLYCILFINCISIPDEDEYEFIENIDDIPELETIFDELEQKDNENQAEINIEILNNCKRANDGITKWRNGPAPLNETNTKLYKLTKLKGILICELLKYSKKILKHTIIYQDLI